MAVTVTWKGDVAGSAADAAERGLLMAGEHIARLADGKVPIRDHHLQESGTVTVAGTEAAVSYNTPYAVIQHERLDFHHPKGGEAKYLEKALREGSTEAQDIIAGQIRSSL